jgi:hypothetical protein
MGSKFRNSGTEEKFQSFCYAIARISDKDGNLPPVQEMANRLCISSILIYNFIYRLRKEGNFNYKIGECFSDSNSELEERLKRAREAKSRKCGAQIEFSDLD